MASIPPANVPRLPSVIKPAPRPASSTGSSSTQAASSQASTSAGGNPPPTQQPLLAQQAFLKAIEPAIVHDNQTVADFTKSFTPPPQRLDMQNFNPSATGPSDETRRYYTEQDPSTKKIFLAIPGADRFRYEVIYNQYLPADQRFSIKDTKAGASTTPDEIGSGIHYDFMTQKTDHIPSIPGLSPAQEKLPLVKWIAAQNEAIDYYNEEFDKGEKRIPEYNADYYTPPSGPAPTLEEHEYPAPVGKVHLVGVDDPEAVKNYLQNLSASLVPEGAEKPPNMDEKDWDLAQKASAIIRTVYEANKEWGNGIFIYGQDAVEWSKSSALGVHRAAGVAWPDDYSIEINESELSRNFLLHHEQMHIANFLQDYVDFNDPATAVSSWRDSYRDRYPDDSTERGQIMELAAVRLVNGLRAYHRAIQSSYAEPDYTYDFYPNQQIVSSDDGRIDELVETIAELPKLDEERVNRLLSLRG